MSLIDQSVSPDRNSGAWVNDRRGSKKEKRVKFSVRTTKGMSFEMAMKPSASIAKLKEKLSGPAGTKASEQVILHGNRILDDQASIDSYHLRDGTILDMELAGGVSVLLIGNRGVGRTAIMNSFINPLTKLKIDDAGGGRDFYRQEVQTS